MSKLFDIVVVGGGHAGVEAANIASQFGLCVGLLTKKSVLLGSAPCNPAIGGVGKGQLVREIDALGGLMGKCADIASIQCRTLNESKGDAVRSTRFQIDKLVYPKVVTRLIEASENIEIIYDEMLDLKRIESGDFEVVTDQSNYFAKKLIVTTGTFLGGVLHSGLSKKSGGRVSCSASVSISRLSISPRRVSSKFKTGTPPRLKKDSVDFSQMDVQPSDPSAQNFHCLHKPFDRWEPQVDCYKTRTTESTILAVLENKEKSPMFNGQIKGTGPRYCPSIEDKVFRYPEKFDHHVFVEPESANLETVYPNGISTSLPVDVQREMIRTIPGFENAEIEIPGYAVEYDVVDTSRLSHSLESLDYEGLFFAGQVNGTSGYEEAAGQGLVAGIGASLQVLGRDEIVFPRGASYLGVLIDDLVSNKRDEPYRLFTARAENRLFIREDNPVIRLGQLRLSFGLEEPIDNFIKEYFYQWNLLDRFFENMTNDKKEKLFKGNEFKNTNKLMDYLNNSVGVCLDFHVVRCYQISQKYKGYISRNEIVSKRVSSYDSRQINYKNILKNLKLSNECKELIAFNQPKTFFHLKNIKGIRPATVSLVASSLS